MKRLDYDASTKLINTYWDNLRQDHFKVEVLQDYSVVDKNPSLDAWLAGDEAEALRLLDRMAKTDPWFQTVRQKVLGGVTLRRVHVVKQPYTPYLQWEIAAYKRLSVPFGEAVRLVEQSRVRDLPLPAGDMMIYDDQRVAVNHYASNGRVTRRDMYDAQTGDVIQPFIDLKHELWKRASDVS